MVRGQVQAGGRRERAVRGEAGPDNHREEEGHIWNPGQPLKAALRSVDGDCMKLAGPPLPHADLGVRMEEERQDLTTALGW